MLELCDVEKRYGDVAAPVRAVDGVTLTVQRGRLVTLLGPSGSGKTTLLQMAAGLLAPDAGTVRFDAIDLARMSIRESEQYRLRTLGLVFQSAQLIPGASALDNAAMKLLLGGMSRRKARERARPWLDRLGLALRASHYPVQLSAGERQRVALARALAHHPQLVLADEPTGNLDSVAGRGVFELLAGIAHEHGVGALLVTHDATAVAVADDAYELRDGRLHPYDGSPRIGTAGRDAAGVRS